MEGLVVHLGALDSEIGVDLTRESKIVDAWIFPSFCCLYNLSQRLAIDSYMPPKSRVNFFHPSLQRNMRTHFCATCDFPVGQSTGYPVFRVARLCQCLSICNGYIFSLSSLLWP